MKSVNDVYSLYIVLALARTFYGLTFCLYGFLYCIIYFITFEIWTNVELFFWIGYHTLQLYQIIHSCTLAATEANRTAVLVHKVMMKTKDPILKDELNLFSMQLLHQKVQFTACGLFPLDFTLLYSIAGAVTTYLVILVQFQETYKMHNVNNSTNITNSSIIETAQ